MADPKYIRDLGNAATLLGAHYGVVDQGADAKRVLLSALQAFYLGSDLAAIAALSPANDDVLQRKAGAWANRTLAQLRADIYASGQIAFPATQNPSADPNTLDDYEEGTWTPTLTTTGTPPTGVSPAVSPLSAGYYTKTGNVVDFWMALFLASKGTEATGSARIAGLPFTVFNATTAVFAAAARIGTVTFSSGYTQVMAAPVKNTSQIALIEQGSGVADQTVLWSNVADTSTFIIGGSFFV